MKNKTKTLTAIALLILGLYMSMVSMTSLTSALTISSVSTNPDSIAPGETAQVSLVVKNNGENDIADVSVGLDFTNLPLAPFNSGSDFNVDELDSDKSRQASFQIIALNDAKSGIYKIPVKIEYSENSIVKTKQSMISIMINSVPILNVEAEDGLLLKGQNNKITLKIINKGLADVKFLDISIDSSTSYDVISQKNVYIGDVDSNDFQTADFSLFFKDNALNTVTIPVTLTYKDITNKEYTQSYDVQIKVYNKQQAQSLGLQTKSNTLYYVVGIITLILVFILYRVIRNKRRKSSEY
ncbi:MAG: CARDB domain-containing protein [Nanoarchaeota archaeon]